MSNERLMDLEIRLTYQEQTIEQLSEELQVQQQQLQRLEQLCNRLTLRLATMQENGQDLPHVVAGIAGRVHRFEPLLGTPFGVAEHAVLLDPHRGGQNEICEPRRRRGIDFGDDQELLLEPFLRVEELVQAEEYWKP